MEHSISTASARRMLTLDVNLIYDIFRRILVVFEDVHDNYFMKFSREKKEDQAYIIFAFNENRTRCNIIDDELVNMQMALDDLNKAVAEMESAQT